MKPIEEMTRKDFDNLPHKKNWADEILCQQLVILPLRRMHDSGFRCMDFVAVSKDSMIRISGGSDVMHIEGISGFGRDWLTKYKGCPTAVRPIPWSIDCLKKSGLLRIFARGYSILCGSALSSFEFWAVPNEEELERRRKYEMRSPTAGE